MSSNIKKRLNTIQIDTGHSAIGPFAGYHYQWFYFILRMLEMNHRGESVDFELRDDVSADENGHLTFYQLKHTVSKSKKGLSNLTLCDPDLWKSINVWLDIVARYVKEGLLIEDIFTQTDFMLVTNKQFDNNEFCKRVNQFQNGEIVFEDLKKYLIQLCDELKDAKSKDDEDAKENKVKVFIDKAVKNEYLPLLLKKLTLKCVTDNDILSDIKFQVSHRAVPDEALEAATNSIIGKVELELYPKVQEAKKISISIDEFDRLILSELSQYRGRTFLPKYKCPITFEEKLSEQTYIKQLIAVRDIEKDDIDEIIRIAQQTLDFIESEKESRAKHTLSNDDWNTLYRNAYNFWKIKFKSRYIGIDKESESDICNAAAMLLDDIRSKSDLKVGDDELGDYLSNGLFYKMSDTNIQLNNPIGWHWNWANMFNDRVNG